MSDPTLLVAADALESAGHYELAAAVRAARESAKAELRAVIVTAVKRAPTEDEVIGFVYAGYSDGARNAAADANTMEQIVEWARETPEVMACGPVTAHTAGACSCHGYST